jgi:hypothetical protein
MRSSLIKGRGTFAEAIGTSRPVNPLDGARVRNKYSPTCGFSYGVLTPWRSPAAPRSGADRCNASLCGEPPLLDHYNSFHYHETRVAKSGDVFQGIPLNDDEVRELACLERTNESTDAKGTGCT